MRARILPLLLPAILFLTPSPARAATMTITALWNANPETNIAGYKLSYGTVSHNYSTTVDVGKVTSAPITVTLNTTYYFAVQAYNTTGLLSGFSTEVAFTATAPVITSVGPQTGQPGTVVMIAGSSFGATQGTSTIAFNGVAATPTSWSATAITVLVPLGATTGNIVVTVAGTASNAVPFTVTAFTSTLTKDFNGDGIADLVWQTDTTRQAAAWYMGGPKGNVLTGSSWLDSVGELGWKIVAVADLNRDGKPDLIWQADTSRQVVVWYMG